MSAEKKRNSARTYPLELKREAVAMGDVSAVVKTWDGLWE